MQELLASAWDSLGAFQELVKAVLISVIAALAVGALRARVKIIWGSTSLNLHSFRLGADGGIANIATEKFFFQNVGRRPARELEVVFSTTPTSYNLWPPRDHEPRALENGTFVLKVPSVAPRELVIVDVIEIERKRVDVLSVNCPDVLATEVRFAPVRQFGKVVNGLIGYLMFAGLVGTIYLALGILFG
ncbi:hypothetical protein [Pseudooceanicola sp. 200-1SW]|uniref:hypothetical protein n=1 Tax=Pseudooceanicola sp. 200-1SW TaxID=3425949 RepID=UPI003D7F23A6